MFSGDHDQVKGPDRTQASMDFLRTMIARRLTHIRLAGKGVLTETSDQLKGLRTSDQVKGFVNQQDQIASVMKGKIRLQGYGADPACNLPSLFIFKINTNPDAVYRKFIVSVFHVVPPVLSFYAISFRLYCSRTLMMLFL